MNNGNLDITGSHATQSAARLQSDRANVADLERYIINLQRDLEGMYIYENRLEARNTIRRLQTRINAIQG